MSYSNEGKGEASLVDSTLPLFGAEEESDGGAAVFFCGGPVWAADWFFLKEEDSIEHYLALSAYRDYDEVMYIHVHLYHITDFINYVIITSYFFPNQYY